MRRPSRQGLLVYCLRKAHSLDNGDNILKRAIRFYEIAISSHQLRGVYSSYLLQVFSFVRFAPNTKTMKTLSFHAIPFPIDGRRVACRHAGVQQVQNIAMNAGAMKIYSTVILLALLMLDISSLRAQTAKENVRLYFESIRSGTQAVVPEVSDDDVRALIRPYLTDSTEAVRIRSRELLFAVASASPRPDVRSRSIEQLLGATEPEDVTGTGVIIPMIKTFERHAFSDSAHIHIRRLVKAEGPFLREWMRIAGFLELKDLENHIRPYAQPGTQQSTRWSALLSLSRMGDERAAMEVLNRVKKLRVNDDLVYKVFPDLAFTRNETIIQYMVEVLHQDANQCLSADIEREAAIPCGYRIMEQLAPIIDEFPVKLEASGDLDVDDYASALHTVRQWFAVRKDYSIRRDKY